MSFLSWTCENSKTGRSSRLGSASTRRPHVLPVYQTSIQQSQQNVRLSPAEPLLFPLKLPHLLLTGFNHSGTYHYYANSWKILKPGAAAAEYRCAPLKYLSQSPTRSGSAWWEMLRLGRGNGHREVFILVLLLQTKAIAPGTLLHLPSVWDSSLQYPSPRSNASWR